MYPEEVWWAMQRHPSSQPAPEEDDGWGDWIEKNFDPDNPTPFLPDRIEDLEI